MRKFEVVMEKYWDPLRKKKVAATPEERVRQWFISFLRDKVGVPEHLMMSEVGMKSGRKTYRADILVYSRSGSPLAVVECKRPDVELTDTVVEQALRYNMVLGVRHIFLTNGERTLLFSRNSTSEEKFTPSSRVPDFDTMQK